MSLRCTVSKGTTGFSPHQVITGRRMKTGIDWEYAQTLEKKEDVDEYIKSLISQLQVIHEATKANNDENEARNKRYYDKGNVEPNFKIGDKVWMLNRKKKQGENRSSSSIYSRHSINNQFEQK